MDLGSGIQCRDGKARTGSAENLPGFSDLTNAALGYEMPVLVTGSHDDKYQDPR